MTHDHHIIDKLTRGVNVHIQSNHAGYHVWYLPEEGPHVHDGILMLETTDLEAVKTFMSGFKAALHHVNGLEFK